ncbi:gemA, miro family protein, partial [Dictyostelium purpureum]
KPNLKICLVGDENVGKTTLINSFILESFMEVTQKVLPEVTIPAEFGNQICTTRIIDTHDDGKNGKTQMNMEIRIADAIVIVYSVDRFDTFLNIRMKWIPLINQLRGSNKPPIIIVGNKLDLHQVEFDANKSQIEETIQYFRSTYPNTIQWVECSAKTLENLPDLLYSAQTSVFFPERVLYNREENKMTEGCEKALKRIFKLCDHDNDGSLSEEEINYFQTKCGHESMTSDEIQNIQQFVLSKIPDGVDSNGFTEKVHANILWTSLRAFQYDDDLNLLDEYLHPQINVPPQHNTVLSASGNAFFKALFEKYDSDSDGILSSPDLVSLFSTTPRIPWEIGFEKHFNTDKDSNLTLSGFLSLWNLQTYDDYKVTLEYLAYFGSQTEQNNLDMIGFSKSRELDIKNGQFSRNIVNCYVFGEEAVGKTTFLNTFIGKTFSHLYNPTSNDSFRVCGHLLKNKYLILNEFVGDKIPATELKNKADLVCLLYDVNSDQSFKFIENIYNQIKQNQLNIPILFIKTKTNNATTGGSGSSHTDSKVIESFFKSNKNFTPKEFSISSSNSIYHEMMETIINSTYNVPAKQENNNLAKYLLIAGGIAGVGFIITKYVLKK